MRSPGRLAPLVLLAAQAGGCAPGLGAHDLSPRSDRRVAVPLLPEIEPHEDRPDFCAWACGPSRRPEERVAACDKLYVWDEAVAHALGARAATAVLCAFR